MSDYKELVKALRDLHRDPRPASAEWLFENQVALYDAAAAIEELQAQLPKRGEWVKNRVGFGWYCSYCKVDNDYAYCWNNEMGQSELKYNYCPSCGAKMEVQE